METRRAVILVEGDSDRIALQTLAWRLGRDLGGEGVEIVSMDGVTNVAAQLGRVAAGVRVAALCDEREAPTVLRIAQRAEIVDLRVEVCFADLEDELIRALGVEGVEQVIAAAGELASFRTLQQMPAQRQRTHEQQLRRFFGTKSGRKLKYARLLVEALDLQQVPRALQNVLT
jgi:predicted ATP-dependent endonuclease of OLD family